MELVKLKVNTSCDNGACYNLADYAIVRRDTVRELSLCLCSNCLDEITNNYVKKKKVNVKNKKGQQEFLKNIEEEN